ncbi:hypothetical protein A2115_01370 [Candidatus Woesebacteria bacterium GWA1_41_8]|uniref:TrpR like protein, YerC/YecD n=1 Tax=Candidatus Woesebacteria bacterium GWA1_41_8 TaxID=1802471 RepID=A0A1F7WM08_9BACT|nr:MAG: hypothetical protein A2115_01370 [Candidatus Woesebacteria bacterium GWA1_41_8]
MRTSTQKLNPSFKSQLIKTFAQTLLDLEKPQEAEVFLKDFFNDAELETFAKRLAVAYWLKKGRSYENIKRNIKISSATVSTIQNLMEKPGFKLAIKKMEAEEWANVWSQRIRKFVRK